MTAQKRRHRPALIALVIVAAVVCLAMAWWQWDRYESSSGTGQNLGYALQWPMFAVAFVYAYRRFVVLESDPEEAEKVRTNNHKVTEIPQGLLPDRPTVSATDPDSGNPEYNQLLKELAEQEKQ
ncbi:hypothetical protein GCM10027169_01410 [Gordonia jinhuaensis]|uniref:DNA-binding transcriptional regulator of glucitol operon n=1 Tax=Gordonia jinhuaensis TaxID=1517702 RepID=A0A916THQ8_9ACTN|nr:transcriptional regulator [Gordonia jinhuaensis]GGB44673.1 hypothetical protein GCM10011489_35170 [Gordonia jinhuaensis]